MSVSTTDYVELNEWFNKGQFEDGKFRNNIDYPLPKEYQYIESMSYSSGYEAAVVQNTATGELVMIHGSSKSALSLFQDISNIKDFTQDKIEQTISTWGLDNGQMTDALNLYNQIKALNPTATISHTGTDLGCLASQYLGALTHNQNGVGDTVVNFNPVGASGILKAQGINPDANYSNITNNINDAEFSNSALVPPVGNDVFYKGSEAAYASSILDLASKLGCGLPSGDEDDLVMQFFNWLAPKALSKLGAHNINNLDQFKNSSNIIPSGKFTDFPCVHTFLQEFWWSNYYKLQDTESV